MLSNAAWIFRIGPVVSEIRGGGGLEIARTPSGARYKNTPVGRGLIRYIFTWWKRKYRVPWQIWPSYLRLGAPRVHSDAVWLRGWPRPSCVSCVTANNFRTTGSIHPKNPQNPKWLLVNCSQLLWPQDMSGQWPTTIVIPAFAGVSGYRPLAGRDAKSPQPITPEPIVAATRARRRSKALKETLLMNALKQFSESVLKFKVRWNVKNRRF